MSQVSNAVKLQQSVKAMVKNNQEKNQSIANSHSLSVKNVVSQEQEQTHQTVQSEQLNTTVVRREVEVLFLAQRKRVRL